METCASRRSSIPRSLSTRAQDDRPDGSWCLELFESRLDYNRRTLIDHFEQFDHVLVTHPHAAVTRSRADFVLVFGAMNVDEAVARIRIVLVQSVQPQNTRRDQVLRRRRRFVRLKRNAPTKTVPCGISLPIFSATRKRPVGVLKLPSSVPIPNRDVDTGYVRIGCSFSFTVSCWSRIET